MVRYALLRYIYYEQPHEQFKANPEHGAIELGAITGVFMRASSEMDRPWSQIFNPHIGQTISCIDDARFQAVYLARQICS